MFAVEIDTSELEAAMVDAQQILERGVIRAVAYAANQGEATAKVFAAEHRQSGALEDNIEARPTGIYSAVIASRAKHSSYLEDGTPPHVIEAKKGKTLAFSMGGSTVFAKRVNHPGTRAYGYMAKAEREATVVLQAQLERAAEEAAARLNRR